jgi:hypothetical protein
MILSRIIFALLVSTQTQQPAKAITFDEPAGTADHILADLSKPTGLQLKTSPEMAKEVLLISVKDVPAMDLLKRIATVTSGQWLEQDGELRLIADQGAREQQRQAEVAAKTVLIKKSLDKLKARFAKPGDTEPSKEPLTQDEDDMTLPFGLLGSGQLAQSLVAEFDAQTIAEMGRDDRVVLSTNPTAMQLPLPPVPSEKLEQFIKDHNKIAAEMEKAKEHSPQQVPPGQEELIAAMGMGAMYKNIAGPPVKISVSIESMQGFMAMMGAAETATMRFYDANGKVTYSEQANVPNGSNFVKEIMKFAKIADKNGTKTPSVKSGTPIQYSSLTTEFGKASLMGTMQSGAIPKMSAELHNRLLHPDNFDPLSFAPSEALRAIAAKKKEQLVADLPDSIAGSFASAEDVATTDKCLAAIGDHVVLDEKTGWMQISPRAQTQERFERIDRKSLAALIANSQAKGLPSLDDLSAFAIANEDPNPLTGIASPYMLVFVPGAMSRMMTGGNDWKTLRLYGRGSPDQREALKKGEPLAYDGLSPDQKQVVQSMVYGSGASLQETKPSEQPKPAPFGIDLLMEAMPFGGAGQIKDYLQEPTECLPQGLSSSVSLQCAYTTSSVVRSADEDGFDTLMGPMGVDEYSLMGFIKTQPLAQMAGSMPKLSKFRVGTRATYDISIQLLPNVYIKKKLVDDSIGLDAPVVSADNLPADFKSQVQARMDEIKKSPFASMMKMPNMPMASP